MTRVVLVDQEDTVIGLKERDELGENDLSRGSGLWVTNSKGEILIARRCLEKKYGAGLWSCAAAGMVDEGEDYLTNMIKETQEEIGILLTPSDLREGPKIRMPRFFFQWYYAVLDLPVSAFTLQKEEVMDIRWIAKDEFLSWVEGSPSDFVESIEYWLPSVLKDAPEAPQA